MDGRQQVASTVVAVSPQCPSDRSELESSTENSAKDRNVELGLVIMAAYSIIYCVSSESVRFWLLAIPLSYVFAQTAISLFLLRRILVVYVSTYFDAKGAFRAVFQSTGFWLGLFAVGMNFLSPGLRIMVFVVALLVGAVILVREFREALAYLAVVAAKARRLDAADIAIATNWTVLD